MNSLKVTAPDGAVTVSYWSNDVTAGIYGILGVNSKARFSHVTEAN